VQKVMTVERAHELYTKLAPFLRKVLPTHQIRWAPSVAASVSVSFREFLGFYGIDARG
jgi:hypothetical protein